MKIGNIEVKKLYLGALELEKVYAGIHLAYTKSHPVPEYDGLTFTAEQANSTVKYNKCSVTTAEYSTDGTNWVNANGVTITLANVGDKVYFRGKVSGNQSDSIYANFTMKGLIAASGSLMSMYNNNPNDTTMTYEKSLQTLFRDCTSLVTAPELPATTLSINCYNNLFYGCTSLVTAPELPATDLKDGCYYHMFYGCTSLVTAPELPATTLKTYCYTGMFKGCSSLVTAPELPATALITSSYGNQWTSTDGMFYGCSSLNYIKCLATSMQSNSTPSWVNGVAATGTFVCPSTTNWTTGTSGIPSGWTRVNSDPQPVEYDGLTFTAEQANSTVKYTKSSYTTAEYSTDGTTWNNADDVTITLANVGDKVFFRGVISGNQSTSNYATFTLTGLVGASGSIMSMYNNNPDDITISRSYAFYAMFKNCTHITTPPELPATNLVDSCYRNMFYGCTSLLYSPELPALSVPERAYNDMFSQCTSLETVNTISCTSVSGQYSMAGMFSECRSLINVPEKLFIQTLSYASLQGMFAKCDLLEIAPELPATTLYQACYIGIFEYCYNLKYIKCLATDISANICTRGWVTSVAATGTFETPVTTDWTTGVNGIPEGWTRYPQPVPTKNYFYFESVDSSDLTMTPSDVFAWDCDGCAAEYFQYSTNGTTWNDFKPLAHYGQHTYTFTGETIADIYNNEKELNKVFFLDLNETQYNQIIDNGYEIYLDQIGEDYKDIKLEYIGRNGSYYYVGCNVGFDIWEECESFGGLEVFIKIIDPTDDSEIAYASGIMSKNSTRYNITNISTLSSDFSRFVLSTIDASRCNIQGEITIDGYSYDDIIANKIYLRGTENKIYRSYGTRCPFTITSDGFNVGGDIRTLVDYNDYTIELQGGDFRCLFLELTNLVSAENLILPYEELWDESYESMFNGCTSLVTAPELSGNTLDYNCYYSMFYGCTSLVTAPELPATTLATQCYQNMFNGCTSLTTAPELPATVLDEYCYANIFNGCTSLVNAPELPATTLARYCYNGMFYGCTSLVTAPELPATKLSDYCYQYMFNGCTSLVNAPELPATTLANYCYGSMFYSCTSLVTAPELPATTLVERCYNQMFSDCTSLVNAPELPATTLTDRCYYGMLRGCTSLVTTPELLATTLATYCYAYMFYGCTNLNKIICLATNISATSCTYNWVSGVASTGTFIAASSSVSWTTGTSGIPSGWTKKYPIKINYNNNGHTVDLPNTKTIYNTPYTLTTEDLPDYGLIEGGEYLHNGWSKTAAGTSVVNVGTKISSTVTLYPIWQKHIGVITYYSKYGTVPSSKSVILPYTLTIEDLPTLPDEPGYTFNGWDKNVGDVITDDITISVKWKSLTAIVYNKCTSDEDVTDGEYILVASRKETSSEHSGYICGADETTTTTLPYIESEDYYLVDTIEFDEEPENKFKWNITNGYLKSIGNNKYPYDSSTSTGANTVLWTTTPTYQLLYTNGQIIDNRPSTNYALMHNGTIGGRFYKITSTSQFPYYLFKKQ